jgi:ribosomal protein S10
MDIARTLERLRKFSDTPGQTPLVWKLVNTRQQALVTLNRSPHGNKTHRDQFMKVTYSAKFKTTGSQDVLLNLIFKINHGDLRLRQWGVVDWETTIFS